MRLYFIPGLGADYRTFQNLRLDKSWKQQHIQWVSPGQDERKQDYAFRLSQQINTDEPFSIVGLSFGGVMAYEIAQILQPVHLIILSGFRPGIVPGFIKVSGALKLHYLIPYKFVTRPNKVTYRIFGAETDSDRELLDQIMQDADVVFFKWAMRSMIKYQPASKYPKAIHIHGTCDRIIPVKYVNPDIEIHQGTHFMAYNRADQISMEINRILATASK